MASNGGESASSYITHHLTSWCVGCNPVTHQPHGLVDLGAFNIDMLLMSLLCAVVVGLAAFVVGRKLREDNPGRLQLTFEAAVEYITEQIREVFPRVNHYVGAMAFTIFAWTLLMNLLDLFPIDVPGAIASGIGNAMGLEHTYFRLVPTASLDVAAAMAVVVFAMTVFYQVRANGPVGYVKRFLFHPYGKYAVPMNIISVLIEDLSKPVSLALRLFGNLFAGELIFALLALLTFGALQQPIEWTAAIWAPLHFLGGVVWSLFDLLIAVLQAFIFAILTIVYLGMAQQTEAH